jgi:hypothetical protein
MKWKYWSVFAVFQFLGVFIPSFANLHSNVWPLFAGLLLVPGVAILFLFHLPTYYRLAIAVLLNAVFWYLGFKYWQESR